MSDDPTQEFIDAVTARAEGTGYEVSRTRKGFRVQRDLSDATHWGPMSQAGIHKLIAHDVVLDADTRQMTIVDEVREIVWTGGAEPRPRWSGGKARRRRGRISERGFGLTYDPSADPGQRVTRDYRYDTNEGRGFVRDAAKELGWREKRSSEHKIGIAVAILGVVGALIAVIALMLAGDG